MYSPVQSPSHSSVRDLRVSRLTTVDSLASPYQNRAKSIGKKFSNLQSAIDTTQIGYKHEQVEVKIRHIDAKITEHHHMTEDRLKDFNNKIAVLEENLAAEIISRELLEERKEKELCLVEHNLALELKNNKQEEKETERRILTRVEEKIQTVRIGFCEEQQKLEELRTEQTEIIAEQINGLHENVKAAKTVREQAQSSIIKAVTEKLDDIRQSVEAERKVRYETESFLYSKIEEISNSLNNQMNAEREKREGTEAQMLMLLEESCNRFEEQTRPSRRYNQF